MKTLVAEMVAGMVFKPVPGTANRLFYSKTSIKDWLLVTAYYMRIMGVCIYRKLELDSQQISKLFKNQIFLKAGMFN